MDIGNHVGSSRRLDGAAQASPCFGTYKEHEVPVKNFQGKNLRSAIFSVAARAAPGFPEKLARIRLPDPDSRRLRTPKVTAVSYRMPSRSSQSNQNFSPELTACRPCRARSAPRPSCDPSAEARASARAAAASANASCATERRA